MGMVITILEAAVLASVLSMDAFIASFAYGSSKIKIPLNSQLVINLMCSSILGVSMAAGTVVRRFVPGWLTTAACFIVLFILGVTALMDSITKSIIRKHGSMSRNLKFSMFNFRFVLSLYADPEAADVDHSKTISPAEAASLAMALSLDGMAVGFGAALGNVNGWAVFFCSLITNALAVNLGTCLGNKAAKKLSFNISWLSGAILILMAVMKVV